MLDAVIEGMGEAFGTHRAAGAEGFDPVLGCAFGEEFVRVGVSADRLRTPALLMTLDHSDSALSPVRPAALPCADTVRKR